MGVSLLLLLFWNIFLFFGSTLSFGFKWCHMLKTFFQLQRNHVFQFEKQYPSFYLRPVFEDTLDLIHQYL